jgi:hypothetical protein
MLLLVHCRAAVGHHARLLLVVVRLHACRRVKRSRLEVVPTHVWARVASEVGWVQGQGVDCVRGWRGSTDASIVSC